MISLNSLDVRLASAAPQMGSMKLLKFLLWGLLLLHHSAESAVYIHFDQAPPARTKFSTAVFRYSIMNQNGQNLCRNLGCSMYGELDRQPLKSCAPDLMVFENLTTNHDHNFLLVVSIPTGEKNSTSYNWYIDTIPPTAFIYTQMKYTSADNITVGITFSEACTGQGGFKCSNASSCDVMINGPANVDASTLQIVNPGLRYSLVIVFSSSAMHGRVIIKTGESFCTDWAGNSFTRTKHSIHLVYFDRRQVHAELRTSIPTYELEIGKVPRTVLATNRTEEMRFILFFRIPVINSTNDILNALQANVGNFVPVPSATYGNRHFCFELKNVSDTEIITVKLMPDSIFAQSGIAVSPVMPVVFLYDTTHPSVVLSTSSPIVTKEANINVVVEFTKPVFGFDATSIEVEGGKVARLEQLSEALYSVTVEVLPQIVVSVLVPEGKVRDVTGNLNLASNKLELRHYFVPAVSVALYSFVTAGILATSLAAAIVAVSSANLAAIGSITSGVNNVVISDPSRNLLGMAGHLQVFVLSDWYSAGLPAEYSETTRGLRWLLPRAKLPWKKEDMPTWLKYPSSYIAFKANCACAPSRQSMISPDAGMTSKKSMEHKRPCEVNSSPTDTGSEFGIFQQKRNVTMAEIPYGKPLSSEEYFIHFLRGEPLSAANVIKKLENYEGWQDLEMNLFWLGVGSGGLLILHFITLLFLKWRTRTSVHGLLSIPRFELFLLILLLPCVGQASTFIIRGGTTKGIVVGALFLAIPTALFLSILLFFTSTIFMDGMFLYKEVKRTDADRSRCSQLSSFLFGGSTTGKWFMAEGGPASFLSRFGILFEDRKGPPLFVSAETNDPSSITERTGSGQSGIGRMRALSSDGSNEEAGASERLLGCIRSAYLILDLIRRVALGILSAAYSVPSQSQCVIAFSITMLQFLCLFLLKPYIRRGVHMVEGISLLCEAILFALVFYIDHFKNYRNQQTIGIIMLILLFVSFVSQLVNEWYALAKCLLRITQAQRSFKLGLEWICKGLVLLYLPKKYWSRLIPGSTQPTTGLAPVVPPSPEVELEHRKSETTKSVSQASATVVPVGTPSVAGCGTLLQGAMQMNVGSNPLRWQVPIQRSRTMSAEGRRSQNFKLEQKSDMKKLRKLARASFSGNWQKAGEGSSSHAPRETHLDESSSNGSTA
ncbi:hypothetical protein COCNU_scaffold020585G000050 [Cocos nucifera]|nr:hypothetical protein [Cocos nucifera]